MNKIKKQATYENLEPIINFARENLVHFGTSENVIPDIILAIEELVVNIVSYAFPNRENGFVELRLELDKKKNAVITIIDEGEPFNVLAAKDPDVSVPINERGIGGMGIYLVKNVVDDIKYNRKDGKNILTISKSIKSAE